jgi:inorganic pyrophosphatase
MARTKGHDPIGELPPYDPGSGDLNAVLEAARGTRTKYKHEPGVGLFVLDGVLPAGLVYPCDFGFVPGTCAEDGDPLDVLVLADEPGHAGTLVPSRLIGVIKAEQATYAKPDDAVRNDRLIAVAVKSRDYAAVASLDDLPPQLMDEIERFWIASNEAKERLFTPLERGGARAAAALVRAATPAATKRAPKSRPRR